MSQGKESQIQWSYLPIKHTNSSSNPPPRRLREKDDKTISILPETIKKPFSKLPSANELLPKLKSTIENPKIALRISIQPLPVFTGKAPQKEALSRSYSESSLNPKTKKRNLRQELNRYQAIRQSDTQYDVKFQSLESSSFSEINKTGMNNLFSQKKSIPMKKKSNLFGSNYNQTIKSTQKISDQQSIKCNQEPLNSSQNLRQSSPEDIYQGNLRGRNQLCSPIKRQLEITNLQRYFLRLNIVYKKYSEIAEESVQAQGIYSSNVVQFNSVYCDIRSLVKAQGEETQDEQAKQHNLIDNPAKPSYLMEKNGSQKQQSQQIKRQQSDSQPHQEKNISKQDLIQGIQDVPKKMETNSKNKKKILEQKQQALGPSVIEEVIYAPFYKLKDGNDKTLIFESRFESGNLAQAAKLSDYEYDLLLQNDINTHGYTQWFFFKVSNTKALEKVKFNILNFQKFDSLFTKGMKVLVYSRHLSSTEAKGWYRSCEKISYQRNQFIQRDCAATSVSPSSPEKKSPSPGNSRIVQETKNLFTLSFEHEFEHSDDEVYFAYNYPYTYTELQTYLAGIEDSKSHISSRRLLCRTLAGNRIDLLTITSQNSQANKQGIVLSARVHPGETVSSFVMKGIIDFLLGDSKEAVMLRDQFIFKIVPMLNADGVVHGNYRCSLSGSDLNRKWRNPQKALHPEIYYFKKMIFDLAENVKVALFCDLHGHSVKKNIFFYGCHDSGQPLACRELPFLLSKLHAPFSFGDCNFLVQRSKQGTARVALYNGLGIPNVFTLESSFCGPSYEDVHFSQNDLEIMGSRMCLAFLIYFSSSPSSSSAEPLSEQYRVLSELRTNFLQDLWDKDNEEVEQLGMEDSDGSDSCPSDDDLSQKEITKIFSSHKATQQPLLVPSRVKRYQSNHEQNSLSQQNFNIQKQCGQTENSLLENNNNQFKWNNSNQQYLTAFENQYNLRNYSQSPNQTSNQQSQQQQKQKQNLRNKKGKKAFQLNTI